MKSRGLVVAIAVVLAVLAAVGVIVYTSNVRDTAISENTTPVLVSTQDIQASTPLDPLIGQGVFQIVNVPIPDVVPGAVTTTDELQGQTATAPIYANEQIPTGRISSGASNNLGIDEGNIGLGLQIDGQAAVNGYVQQGDNITVYATFGRGTLVTKQSLKFLLTPAQFNKAIQQILGGAPVSGASAAVFQMQTDLTVSLIPSVEVLAVQNPPVDTTTGSKASGASTFVLNLTPEDAQQLVFATGHSTLYLGLLPPDNEGGYPQPGTVGVPFARVIGLAR